jgi:twitching motility protein PilT
MDAAEICRAAVRKGASDIHLKVGLPPMLRISGSLMPLAQAPRLTMEVMGKFAWSMMNPLQRERFKVENDLDLAWQLSGVGRFRVNVFRQRQSIGMVLRTIPTEVKTIDELRLPSVLKDIAVKPRGLVLVTGTTGSGKSTTLAALIEEVNRTLPHHILTIEDPVEFTFQDRRSIVNQREIGVDSMSFAAALRAALRQDPDIILVGELRDRETVEIAMQAAETGHLVLSTLHTLDAPEAINRMIGFFEPHHQQHVRYQLASTLNAVLSQRLVPTKTGGRVAAIEIMLNTGTISECITDPARVKEIPDHIARGSKVYRTQTFDQSVFRLLKSGVITEEAALLSVNNPDELALRLRGIGSDDWD